MSRNIYHIPARRNIVKHVRIVDLICGIPQENRTTMNDLSKHFPREQIGTIVGHSILQKSAKEISEWLEKRNTPIYQPTAREIALMELEEKTYKMQHENKMLLKQISFELKIPPSTVYWMIKRYAERLKKESENEATD